MNKNLAKVALAAMLAPIFGTKFGQLSEAMGRDSVPWVTYNYQGAVLAGSAAGPTYAAGLVTVAEVKFDMAVIAAARTAAGQAAIAATDVLQVIGCKAGTWVPLVVMETTKVEGATATVDVGDGTSTAGYFAGANLNALGYASSLVTSAFSVAVGGGRLYAVDDTIDIVVNNNGVDVSTFRLLAAMVDFRAGR